ncbi:homodomain-containing protein [Encephalitozoon intestinalis]
MNPNPNAQERESIASQSLISKEKVRNWFQNRRSKERGDDKVSSCLSISDANFTETGVHPMSNDLYIRR